MVSEILRRVIDTEDQSRIAQYAEAWRLYEGRFSKPLRVRPGSFDDNIVCNYIRVVVDSSVAFLFGREVSFDIAPDVTTDAEEYLKAVWEANSKMLFLQQMGLTGAVCGHVFVKIVPNLPWPRLVLLDPSTVSVEWEPTDYSQVVRYVITYSAKSPRTDQLLTFREEIERDGLQWRVTQSVSENDSPTWTVIARDLWRWPFPPIVDCQNLPLPHSYYGQSDITPDIIALNQSINFVLSNMNRIIRYHAHPRVWGRGVATAKLDVSVDEAILLPNPEAELRVLEMQSDLSSSINLFQRLKEALHQVSRTPEVALGKVESIGALSGIALRVLYQPLLQKTESKRRTYGGLLRELNRRLLAMAGYGDDIQVTVHWQEAIEGDDFENAKTAILWQQLGVSQHTILHRLGFDPEQERELREVSAQTLGEQILTAFERGQ